MLYAFAESAALSHRGPGVPPHPGFSSLHRRDGLNFLRHYYRKLFDDPQHGAVPIGWQVGPTAADTMPNILDYYYKHARPSDCFMNALTRVGYIHEDIFADNFPPEQREEILREFVRLPGIYRAKIDASIMATFAEMRAERLERIAAITGIKGIVANYGRTHATTQENLSSLPNASAVIDNRWRNELQLSAVHHHSHRRWETRMDVASYPRIRRVQLRRRLKRVAARHTHPRRVWSRDSAYTKDQVAKGEKR